MTGERGRIRASVCGREGETERRGLASDGTQMATDTMHNNDTLVRMNIISGELDTDTLGCHT